MKKNRIIGLAILGVVVPTAVFAASTFYKSGTVKRVLTSTTAYGKCMIQLDTAIGSNCTSSWVSLDCEGKYLDKGDGDRMLNLATIAQVMDKKVSVKVDRSKTFNGYCIATRLDLLSN